VITHTSVKSDLSHALLTILISLLLAVIAFALTARAQEPAERSQAPRPDNYYAAGDRVDITTPKAGDVVVAGRQVEIAQPVGGDILAAGWRVNLSGLADDDVRIAGAEVSINASVKGDLTVAGGDVKLGTNAEVSGRSWLTGNAVRVDGICDRELRVAGATVTIGGEVRKPLYVIADTLEVLPSARILAPLTYKSPKEARIASGAVMKGPITYSKIQERESRQARAFPGVSTFLFSTHLFLAGLLVLMFFPRVESTVIAALRDHPGKSIIAGFAVLVCVPVVTILLIISIIGLPFGFALAALYAMALFASVVITAFFVGDAEVKLFGAGPIVSRGQHVLMLLAGVLTLAVLRTLLGGVIVFASVLFGLGALMLVAYGRYARAVSAVA
jgi:hypothetical protein